MRNWKHLSWIKTCIELIAGTAIAGVIYLVIMNMVVSKAILFPTDTKRIIEINNFCSSVGALSRNQSVFIVGSSIAVEGIDASLIDKALGNSIVYNLGIVGLTPVEALILEPAFEAGRPKLAVIGVDVMAMGVDEMNTDKQSIAFEKLQAFRATNPVMRLGSDVKRELLEHILLPDERMAIESSYLRYLIDCRSLPIFFTESKFREAARRELRTDGAATNFKSPWMLKSSLTGIPRERVINITVEKARRLRFDKDNRQIKAIRTLVSSLRAENIDLILVLWPIHPHILNNLSADLIESTGLALKKIAHENRCAYENYSDLLSDHEFADALHPNIDGRVKLSSRLASALKDPDSALAQKNHDWQ